MIIAHADVVGSLLRPPELLKARNELAAGTIGADQFKKIEDKAVDDTVALQEEVGLEVVTDGEMRRESFQSQMTVDWAFCNRAVYFIRHEAPRRTLPVCAHTVIPNSRPASPEPA